MAPRKAAPKVTEDRAENPASDPTSAKDSAPRKVRDIPGGFSYLTSTGTLRKILEKIIDAQRPDKLNPDYVENIFKMRGGSARASISVLKRMGFLNSDGTPTELFAKFKTENGRSSAALKGLQNAFAEIFKKSETAYAADDAKLRDLIVEITGLQKNDTTFHAIKGTFNVIRSFVKVENLNPSIVSDASAEHLGDAPPIVGPEISIGGRRIELGLKYDINIVLPETSDLNVLNAILKSPKENLLK